MDLAEVKKEGFLVKKGHVRHNWRTRWFVLKKSSLFYFKRRGDATPAGAIPLIGGSLACLPPEASRKQWVMQLTTQEGKEFLIHAPDQSARDEWKTAIVDCITKLDPVKANNLEGTLSRSLSRAREYAGTMQSYRDIVQAMQDRNAGLKLKDVRAKGARQSTMYFNGKDVVDWLIYWSFASGRSDAVALATTILRHGLFNPVRLCAEEGVLVSMASDSLLSKNMADGEDATYTFVAFAPGEAVNVFSSDSDSDSDSDDDILMARVSSSNGVEFDNVLKQGFLLKKGHLRHNWKARKFVLKERCEDLLYYRGSKGGKALGTIPLRDVTVTELDNEEDGSPTNLSEAGAQQRDPSIPISRSQSTITSASTSQSQKSVASRKRSKTVRTAKVNRMSLITSTGVRYVLQASSPEDRDAWVSQIRIASRLISN